MNEGSAAAAHGIAVTAPFVSKLFASRLVSVLIEPIAIVSHAAVTPVKCIEAAAGYGAPVGAAHESVGFDPSISDPVAESVVQRE